MMESELRFPTQRNVCTENRFMQFFARKAQHPDIWSMVCDDGEKDTSHLKLERCDFLFVGDGFVLFHKDAD